MRAGLVSASRCQRSTCTRIGQRGAAIRCRAKPNWRSSTAPGARAPITAPKTEMADDFRAAGRPHHPRFRLHQVSCAPEQAAPLHDYGFATQRAARQCDHRQLAAFPARAGRARTGRIPPLSRSGRGGRRVRRAVPYRAAAALPASDPAWFPFYELCIEAKVPALIFVGTTGLGAGFRGGMGIVLDIPATRAISMRRGAISRTDDHRRRGRPGRGSPR